MSEVPDDVRARVAEAHRRFATSNVQTSLGEIMIDLVMADRAARPSVQPEPLTAREEAEIREDEREACAKVAEEDYTPGYGTPSDRMEWFAEAQRNGIAGRIRNRRATDRQRSRATPPEGETE